MNTNGASSRPRALLLAPETPYPLAGGGALRTASLLHYLAARYDVDLVVFRQPSAPDPFAQIPERLVRRSCVIDLPFHRRGPAARGLRNAARLARRVPPLIDRFAGFHAPLASAIGDGTYDVGVIEHFWCAPYWEQIAPRCAHTVLDLHNIESVLHARCAKTERGPAAVAHRVFARAALDLERAWLPRFSEILTASDWDAGLVLERAPGARVTVYPNAIPLPVFPSVNREHTIVFSGNLEYDPNRSAVRFFRHQIWPQLRERWPALTWRLVGKNPHAVAQWTAQDARIEVRGPVPDAIPELARAQVAVVPLLAGSGTRLKILEAWAAGLPVVSTTLGAEGLPAEHGRNLLLADSPSDFADAVSRLLASAPLREDIGCAGRRLVEDQFTWEKVWQNLQF